MLGRSFQTPNAIDAGERPASRPSRNHRFVKSGDDRDVTAHHSYEDDPPRRQNQSEEKLVGQNQHGSKSNDGLFGRRFKGTKILFDDNDNKSSNGDGFHQQQKQQQQRLLPKDEDVNSKNEENNNNNKKKKKKKNNKQKEQGQPKDDTDDTEEAVEEDDEDVDPREYAAKILSAMTEQYEDDATMLSSHSESISSLVNLQLRLREEKKRWSWNNMGKLCTLLFFLLLSLVLLVVLFLVRNEHPKTKHRVLYYIFSVCFLMGTCVAIIMCIMCIAASFHEQQQQRQHQNRSNNNNHYHHNTIDSDTILLHNEDDSLSSYVSIFRPSMWGTKPHSRRMYQAVPANLAPTRDRHDIEAAESFAVHSETMLNIMSLSPSTPSIRNSIFSPPAPTEEAASGVTTTTAAAAAAAAAAATTTTTTTTIQNNSNDITHLQGHGDENCDQETDRNLYHVDLGS